MEVGPDFVQTLIDQGEEFIYHARRFLRWDNYAKERYGCLHKPITCPSQVFDMRNYIIFDEGKYKLISWEIFPMNIDEAGAILYNRLFKGESVTFEEFAACETSWLPKHFPLKCSEGKLNLGTGIVVFDYEWVRKNPKCAKERYRTNC